MQQERFDAADPTDEASRQALYRRLEGFSEHEPLLCRDPASLGHRREAYWRLTPTLWLRRLPMRQLLPMALAILVLSTFWPITLGIAGGILRVLLGLRMLLIPALALMLAVWFIHTLRSPR